jgi:hypothetical protein
MKKPNQKIVYQYDLAGRYIGTALADESPREPGVFLIPARSTEQAPPPRENWPAGTFPRWIGSGWAMTGATNPQRAPETDPLEKLAQFLQANPDVLAAMEKTEQN